MEGICRLTGSQGQLHHRPKYSGNLVMGLTYEKLDVDVAEWLKEHAPAPRRARRG
jgi:hypothetical protein